MTRPPQGRDLEGPINDVLVRCMNWAFDHAPPGPGGRQLKDASITVEQNRRRAVFQWKDGAKAHADAQIVGFYRPAPDAPPGAVHWRWAWDDPSFDKAMIKHALALKSYGERRKLAEFTIPVTFGHRDRCWNYAALAAALGGASGVAGCQVDDKMALLTIGPVQKG
jgi:hypothetical protein